MVDLSPNKPSPAEDCGEPISVYSDAQAIEDGTIADIGSLKVNFRGLPVNRMTGHLFGDLANVAQSDDRFSEEPADEVLRMILRTKCQFAQGSPDNTGENGDIWRIPPNLWLVRNEVSGWTAMYPEDY